MSKVQDYFIEKEQILPDLKKMFIGQFEAAMKAQGHPVDVKEVRWEEGGLRVLFQAADSKE